MAETISGKLTEAGNRLGEAAQKAVNKVSEKATEAKDWAKQQLDKAGNRIDEKATEARNADEEARVDEAAKNG